MRVRGWWWGVGVGALAAVAACSATDGGVPPTSSASGVTTPATTPATDDVSPTSTRPVTAAPGAASSSTSVAVPPGTRLRIADQYGLFAGVMGWSGEGEDVPYELDYRTFSPGPLQLEAFQAGEVDLGVVSPFGLIQAASGGVELRAVARWRTDFSLYGVVAAPGRTATDWAALQGARVAFQRNTMAEALLVLNLDRFGMTLGDITVVDVTHSLVGVALETGEADVGVSSEPFISGYLSANPDADVAFDIMEPLAQSTIVVARDDVLADPARAAAVAEYLQRLDRAFTAVTSDRERFTELAIQIWKLDRDEVERVLEHSHGVAMAGVPGDLAAPYRRLVELLAGRGLVDAGLDADAMFDDRFNALFAP